MRSTALSGRLQVGEGHKALTTIFVSACAGRGGVNILISAKTGGHKMKAGR